MLTIKDGIVECEKLFQFFSTEQYRVIVKRIFINVLMFSASKKNKNTPIEHRVSRLARRERPFTP